MSLSSPKRWLTGLVGAFVVLCVAYSVTLPIFEAPDEAAHFKYADYLARQRRLPNLRIQDLPSHEVTQPVLYYALVALAIAPFDRSNLDQLVHLNPDWFDSRVNRDYQGVRGQHLHIPELERFPYFGAALAVHVARLIAVPLGVMVVVLVYLTARELIAPQQPRAQALPLLAVALTAFNPKFIHISSIVNNDIAITLAATATVWWMARLSRVGASVARFWALGMAIGAAVLSKLQGLGLLVPALIVWWLVGERRGLYLVALLGGTLLISGAWFLFNTLNYGDPLAVQQIQQANQALLRFPPMGLPGILRTVPQWFTSYWGNIGIELHYDAWVNGVLFAALAAAVVGCVIACAQGLPMIANRRGFVVMLAWQATLLLMFVWWLRTYVGTENSRLIMPGVSGVATLTAMGWLTLMPLRVMQRLVAAPVAGLAVLAVAVPPGIILPNYTPPPTLDRESIIVQHDLPRGERYTTFNGAIELLHAAVARERVRPGEVVEVVLFWGALRPLKQSYYTVLELVKPPSGAVQKQFYVPYHGRFATTKWTPGAYFRDVYRFLIPPNIAGGAFELKLSLLAKHPEPGCRPLPTESSTTVGEQEETPPCKLGIDGANGVEFLIRRVKVVTTDSRPPLPATGLATFGDTLRLIQWERTDNGLRLEWAVLRQPDADYTLFVHVLDANGNLLAQHDAQPFDGHYPTSLWDANERLAIDWPVALPPKAAGLHLGWYLPSSGQRLPVRLADGNLSPDNMLVVKLLRD